MKKIVISAVSLAALTTSALAADLPSRKEPVVAPPPPPMWTGFHVGLNAGGTWANNSNLNVTTWNTSLATTNRENDPASAALLSGGVPTSATAGFIGGGQIGYDWQVNYGGYGFVTGVEADIQGIAASGGAGQRTSLAETVVFYTSRGTVRWDDDALSYQKGTASLNYIGTVRGRIGFLATPTLLVYGTGGLAYGGINMSLQNYQPYNLNRNGISQGLIGVVGGYQSYSNTQVGWTAGGGAEWMFMPNWSAKVEYLYYDLGNASASTSNILYPGAVGTAGGLHTEMQNISNFSTRFNGNIVRAGVNYHFNWGTAPVVAKY